MDATRGGGGSEGSLPRGCTIIGALPLFGLGSEGNANGLLPTMILLYNSRVYVLS